MRCHRARRLLSPYMDHEIDPGGRASLEQHLAGCERCAAELERLKRQWNALGEDSSVPPLPPELWREILRSVEEAERLPWQRRHRGPLLQAACVAAGVALGLSSGVVLSWKPPLGEAGLDDVLVGECVMVAEAFDATTFGLGESQGDLLQCE